MGEIILSLEERSNKLLERSFEICYEDNPKRVGWELHSMNSDVNITFPDDIKTDVYYLIDVYLNENLIDKLYNITEGFPMWLNTYKSGRCSIDAMINEYTPEKLEDILEEMETNISIIENERNKFINRQK